MTHSIYLKIELKSVKNYGKDINRESNRKTLD